MSSETLWLPWEQIQGTAVHAQLRGNAAPELEGAQAEGDGRRDQTARCGLL